MRRLAREEAVPVVIVNPSTPIGPRDIKPTPTGKMVLDAAAGRMPAYVDTGLNVVHVDDVALGHVLALERGEIGESYILGGTDLGMAEILAMVDDIMGRAPRRRPRLPHAALWPVALGMEGAARAFHIEPLVTREMLAMARKRMFFSSAKAQAQLGYAYRPPRAGAGRRDRLVPRRRPPARMTVVAAVALLVWVYLLAAHGRFWQAGPVLEPAQPAERPASGRRDPGPRRGREHRSNAALAARPGLRRAAADHPGRRRQHRRHRHHRPLPSRALSRWRERVG